MSSDHALPSHVGYIVQPEYRCSYDAGAGRCPEAAIRHLAWDVHLQNGLTCGTHLAEAMRHSPIDWHPVAAECIASPAVWVWSTETTQGHCEAEIHPELQALAESSEARA